ncbi:MAG: aldose 1-epimerase family protein [Thermoguttaceae bacterium]
MASRHWTLIDQDQDLYVDQIVLGPEHVGGPAACYSVSKRTLQAGRSRGVEVVEVRSGDFRFTLLPTRGMGIWKAGHHSKDGRGSLDLGWRSPVRGPVHPALVRLSDPGGLGWLDGFDEFLVRCGLESNGAPEFSPDGRLLHGLHGKIANTPAHKLEVTIDGDLGSVCVTGTVDEARLFGNKLRLESSVSTRVDRPGLVVTDTITSLSAEPVDLELLYHVNFGLPLLTPGAKVVLPVRKMAPRDAVAAREGAAWSTYGPETPGLPESCFFFDLAADAAGRTQALLRNAAGTQGVSLRFAKSQLPCFTLWKNCQAAVDGYVTGLEPGINFPNAKSFEKRAGRVAVLSPGQSRTFELAIEPHADADAVRDAEAAVAALQRGVVPQILAKPDPAWSAG